MKLRSRNLTWDDTPEGWEFTQDTIANNTTGVDEGLGLRLRAERLSDDERGELVRLTREAGVGGGLNLTRLSKRDRARWETLAEKGAGKEKGSIFARARKAAETAAEFAELAAEIRKPPRRIDLHEAGSVTLPREWVHEPFDRPDPALFIFDLGLLAFLAGQFENGRALTRNGRIEGTGDDMVLVIDARVGLGAHLDEDDTLFAWERSLDHLVSAEFFVIVEKTNLEIRLRRGRMLLEQPRRAA